MFGDGVVAGKSTAVGLGLHAFRDPRKKISRRYACRSMWLTSTPMPWTGRRTRSIFSSTTCWYVLRPRPPAYPMQLMVGVFDFPEKSDGTDAEAVPELIVDYVREYQR